jgi:hypothetical protein
LKYSLRVLFKARTFDLFGLNTLPTTHIWTSLCKELPRNLLNTELFKLCPFIPELKLWVFLGTNFYNRKPRPSGRGGDQLKPLQKGRIRAVARPLYIGSKVAVGFGELLDEKGETLAVATATFYIRDLEAKIQ